jgi:hypothetical protein
MDANPLTTGTFRAGSAHRRRSIVVNKIADQSLNKRKSMSPSPKPRSRSPGMPPPEDLGRLVYDERRIVMLKSKMEILQRQN